MEGILPAVRWSVKERLLRSLRKCPEARLRTRYLIVVNLIQGRTAEDTSRVLSVARSTVYRVAKRFREEGELGLVDRRCDNGQRKVEEDFLGRLDEVVRRSPQEYGWCRPTWTRELLVTTMARLTGIQISLARMSTALHEIGARRGRPKPTVGCPWAPARRKRRLAWIRRLVANLPEGEVAAYVDEVDVHLNPKIGLDWMGRGQQKEVLTPGQNEKRYLAGALDAHSGELIWVEGDSKNSMLFVRLLWELTQRYPTARRIHVILDNYSIHRTALVQTSLRTEQGCRLKLHFLPPYCPDANRIERTWQDLHANVTRNHCCPDMDTLMANVRRYLQSRSRNLIAA
jgi:transposase